MYYGGYFKAVMTFPPNYPYSPPSRIAPNPGLFFFKLTQSGSEFKFKQPIYHPNIYTDGEVCISILHSPGEDEMSGETAAERWSPAQRAESVLISILSLLDDPECSSPANVEAGIMLRRQPDTFRELVRKSVEASKDNIPPGFEMPTEKIHVGEVEEKEEDPDFWAESGGESDAFGGSDSDEEMEFDNSTGTDEDDEDEDMTLIADEREEEEEEA